MRYLLLMALATVLVCGGCDNDIWGQRGEIEQLRESLEGCQRRVSS